MSSEHDVSVATANSIQQALEHRGHQVLGLTIGRDGAWLDNTGQKLAATTPASFADAARQIAACDIMFPAVHGPHGEDGTLAALGDLLALPIVSSPVGAGAVAMDKAVTKQVAQSLGIGVAPATLLHRDDPTPVVNLPVVVKPVAAGSSHGVTLVQEPTQLPDAVRDAFTLDDQVLVEDLVLGREIDIAIFRDEHGELVVSAPLEILRDGVFTAAEKYDGSARFVVPAPLEPNEFGALKHAAVALYTALRCRSLARLDFFLTDGDWVLNEINTAPGLTAHSQAPRMFEALGLSYPDLLEQLIAAALAGQ